MKLQRQTTIYTVTYTCGHSETKKVRLTALSLSKEEAKIVKHATLQAVIKCSQCAEYR
jgi:hypothetical protein